MKKSMLAISSGRHTLFLSITYCRPTKEQPLSVNKTSTYNQFPFIAYLYSIKVFSVKILWEMIRFSHVYQPYGSYTAFGIPLSSIKYPVRFRLASECDPTGYRMQGNQRPDGSPKTSIKKCEVPENCLPAPRHTPHTMLSSRAYTTIKPHQALLQIHTVMQGP